MRFRLFWWPLFRPAEWGCWVASELPGVAPSGGLLAFPWRRFFREREMRRVVLQTYMAWLVPMLVVVALALTETARGLADPNASTGHWAFLEVLACTAIAASVVALAVDFAGGAVALAASSVAVVLAAVTEPWIGAVACLWLVFAVSAGVLLAVEWRRRSSTPSRSFARGLVHLVAAASTITVVTIVSMLAMGVLLNVFAVMGAAVAAIMGRIPFEAVLAPLMMADVVAAQPLLAFLEIGPMGVIVGLIFAAVLLVLGCVRDRLA